jgi:hypothetical protein
LIHGWRLFAFVVLVYTGFQEFYEGVYRKFEVVGTQSGLKQVFVGIQQAIQRLGGFAKIGLFDVGIFIAQFGDGFTRSGGIPLRLG